MRKGAHYAMQSYEFPAIPHLVKRMFLLDLQAMRVFCAIIVNVVKITVFFVIICNVVCPHGENKRAK